MVLPRHFVLLACLLPAAAGCLDRDDAETDDAALPPQGDPGATAVAAREPEVTTGSFGWLLGVGLDGNAQSTVVGQGNAVPFEVPEGATLVRAEAEWTCASPQCPLHAGLHSEDEDARGRGDGAASVEAIDPAPGEWWFWVATDRAAATAQLEGTVRITVFFDLHPPAAGLE